MSEEFLVIEEEEAAEAMFELSQHPRFPVLFAIMGTVVAEYDADMPIRDDQVTRWQTSNFVKKTVQLIIERIGKAATAGEELTRRTKGDTDVEEDGHNGRDERERA